MSDLVEKFEVHRKEANLLQVGVNEAGQAYLEVNGVNYPVDAGPDAPITVAGVNPVAGDVAVFAGGSTIGKGSSSAAWMVQLTSPNEGTVPGASVQLTAASMGLPGTAAISAGNSPSGSTSSGGDVSVKSGSSDGGNGGIIQILAGSSNAAESAGFGGYIEITGGAGTGEGGALFISGGACPGGIGGSIELSAGTGSSNGVIRLLNIPSYANNTAARNANLMEGSIYYTNSSGEYILKIVHL